MNRANCDILKSLAQEPFLNQRELAGRCRSSLGVINRSLRELFQAGYVDETADRWLICKQNVEAVTRLAIRVLRESYTDAQREPLGRLLEYVAYEIEHTEK